MMTKIQSWSPFRAVETRFVQETSSLEKSFLREDTTRKEARKIFVDAFASGAKTCKIRGSEKPQSLELNSSGSGAEQASSCRI